MLSRTHVDKLLSKGLSLLYGSVYTTYSGVCVWGSHFEQWEGPLVWKSIWVGAIQMPAGVVLEML
jgi:hypothetical protein